MRRASPRWTAPLLAAFLACAASAQASEEKDAPSTAIQDVTPQPPRPIEDRRVPGGKKQSSGEAKWNTELGRQVFVRCPDEMVYEATKRGASLDVARQRVTGNCARNLVFVRNDSGLAIQCRVSLVYPKPDHWEQARTEEDAVIYPWMEDAVVYSYANEDNAPTDFTASCFAIPATPTPYTSRAECRPAFEGPSPMDFYPPGSVRRSEEGAVVLEFQSTAESKLADVRVAQSSGFATLDSAALRYARHLRATSPCVGERIRFKVNFRLTD